MEEKIISALNLTFENIKGLNEEANILKEHSKYGRTYTLFHLCFEECGRFYLLHDYLMDYFNYKIKPRDLNYGKLKALGYENHQSKLTQSFEGMKLFAKVFMMMSRDQNNLPIKGIDFEKELQEIENRIDDFSESEKELDRLKNVGLYITYSDNDFHLPDRTITVKQYLNIQKLANLGTGIIEMMMEFYNGKGGFTGYKKELRKLIKEGKIIP
ncbi:AbiV family abortive infection protein [Tenacibaculum soleae]|uniref:AbiV family abortive infection protein n=1 Tax=Tenacibaculum soleae TaxID=447689 RepID=UPI0026E1C1F7|nr:AbiV family abortive infection protein [Tenacibaculum soleae]MDO6745535.1 AbiV family abortive infection protein [Tenacibaculum soleae]